MEEKFSKGYSSYSFKYFSTKHFLHVPFDSRHNTRICTNTRYVLNFNVFINRLLQFNIMASEKKIKCKYYLGNTQWHLGHLVQFLKRHVTRKRLAVEQNGLKFGTLV